MQVTFRCHNKECQVRLSVPTDSRASMKCPRCGHVHEALDLGIETGITARLGSRVRLEQPEQGITEAEGPAGVYWEVSESEFICPECEESIWLEEDVCPECGAKFDVETLEERLLGQARKRLTFLGLIPLSGMFVVLGALGFFGWMPYSVAAFPPIWKDQLLQFSMIYGAHGVVIFWLLWRWTPAYPLSSEQRRYSKPLSRRRNEIRCDLFFCKTDGRPLGRPGWEVSCVVWGIGLLVGLWLYYAVWLM